MKLKQLLGRLFSPTPIFPPLRVGILISGRGSNMEALIRHARKAPQKNIIIATVISDRAEAKGLEIARNYGINATYIPPGKFKTKLEGDSELDYIRYLQEKKVDIVCLAGFVRVVKPAFLKAFPGRILNIHPSLLPEFPGLNVHERVLATDATHTGCSVHFVNEGIDTGPIICQAKLRIHSEETPQTLSKRVLTLEHKIYWKALLKVASTHPSQKKSEPATRHTTVLRSP